MIAGEERDESRTSPVDPLAAHRNACEECRSAPPAVEAVSALLGASRVEVDAQALSRRALAAIQPEMKRLAASSTWRRVAAGVLLSLLPLPFVVAYDAYILGVVYDAASALLPTTFAAYLVLSYAAFLVLLFAGTYAAIPLLVMRRGPQPAGAVG